VNQRLSKLQPYPFEQLASLCADITPAKDFEQIRLSIGEPQHEPPPAVLDALQSALAGVIKYPPTPGSVKLRETICQWLSNRFALPSDSLSPTAHVLPVAGTREALFAIAQCVFDSHDTARPHILMPNPFYQIYEGAALLAGANPWFYSTPAALAYQPDLDTIPEDVWASCQLLYICTPGNPSGAVVPTETLKHLIELADRYNFTIVSDECYSEIYHDETNPPAGLLQAAFECGNHTYKNCVVFNSLSKRSNLPGLRSGFVAGDAAIIKAFLQYRTYHGCAMPVHTDTASVAAWSDEQHVVANRSLYREKFARVLPILADPLNLQQPEAGFFLWPNLQRDDTEFTRLLLREKNVLALPGSYLSRSAQGNNPGARHIRLALVAPVAECIDAASRIADCLQDTN
jgi:N-succinyldiaminopimelate aminotransferase